MSMPFSSGRIVVDRGGGVVCNCEVDEGQPEKMQGLGRN